jgi:hypothetical protein
MAAPEEDGPLRYYDVDSNGFPLPLSGAQASAAGTRARCRAAPAEALCAAADALRRRLPPGVEDALRAPAAAVEPFLPHLACALAGLLLGRLWGRRAERRAGRSRQRGGGGAPSGAPARRGSAAAGAEEAALEAALRRADDDAKRSDRELSALHAEMRNLERQLERTPASRAPAGSEAAAGAALREKVAEAASAYDTLGRVLQAERASAALRLARANAENELLAEQLAAVRVGPRRRCALHRRGAAALLLRARAPNRHGTRARAARRCHALTRAPPAPQRRRARTRPTCWPCWRRCRPRRLRLARQALSTSQPSRGRPAARAIPRPQRLLRTPWRRRRRAWRLP